MIPSFWPHLTTLSIVSNGTKMDPPGATFGPRKQKWFEFVWIRSGSALVRVNKKKIRCPADSLLLVPPGVTDSYDWSRSVPTVHSWIHFEIDSHRDWPPLSRWPLWRALPPDHTLFHLFRQALSYSPLNSGRFLQVFRPTVEMMLRLYLNGPLDSPGEARFDPGLSPPVVKSIQWLNKRVKSGPLAKIQLAEMAKAAAVSPAYLCRLFKKELRIGPMESARLLKAEYAGVMLDRSNLTIKEISNLCGFENPFHFSRVFKEVYGLSPKAYRESFKKGDRYRPYSPIFHKYRLQKILITESLRGNDPSFNALHKKYNSRTR